MRSTIFWTSRITIHLVDIITTGIYREYVFQLTSLIKCQAFHILTQSPQVTCLLFILVESVTLILQPSTIMWSHPNPTLLFCIIYASFITNKWTCISNINLHVLYNSFYLVTWIIIILTIPFLQPKITYIIHIPHIILKKQNSRLENLMLHL